MCGFLCRHHCLQRIRVRNNYKQVVLLQNVRVRNRYTDTSLNFYRFYSLMHGFVSSDISRRVGLKNCELFVCFAYTFRFPTTGDKIFVTLSRSSNGLASYKRTQHYWPTTPNIGCYMLCLFVHPAACCYKLLGVVAQSSGDPDQCKNL